MLLPAECCPHAQRDFFSWQCSWRPSEVALRPLYWLQIGAFASVGCSVYARIADARCEQFRDVDLFR